MRQKKFSPGSPYGSVVELIRDLLEDRWIIWGERPKHPGVLRAMTVHTLEWAIRAGIIRKAIENKQGGSGDGDEDKKT